MALYAKGMSTRDIVDTFEEMYGVDISPALVSQVTNSVMERIVEWQSRPLEPVYPIVYLDCIVVKIRQDKRVINKAVYLALCINRITEQRLTAHLNRLSGWLKWFSRSHQYCLPSGQNSVVYCT